MPKPFMVRQGDVLIVAAPANPALGELVPRDKGRIVLAYGEATGHAHAIMDHEAELRTLPNTDDRFLRIMATSGVKLQHEEHTALVLPKGDYIVRRQREHVPNALPRYVAD